MASLSDAVARPRVYINTDEIPSEDGNNVTFNRPLLLADAIEKQPEATVAPKVQSQPTVSTDQSSSDPEPSKVQAILDKLFGLHGQERYQLWPEKLARDALSAPHDVMTGQIPQYEVDPVSGEVHTGSGMIKAAQDVSALAGTGGLAGVGNEAGMALGSGPLKQAMVNTNKPTLDYNSLDHILNSIGAVFSKDKSGKSNSTYYFVDTPNGKQKIRVSNHQSGYSDPNTLELPVGSDFHDSYAKIAELLGKDIDNSALSSAKKAEAQEIQKTIDRWNDLKLNKSYDQYGPYDYDTPIKINEDRLKTLMSDNEAGLGVGALAQTNKPFYSAVENAVTAAKQPKADIKQWLSFLKNQPGVKQEELSHLGLDKLSGSITKDDLLKAVQEGQPQIKEVVKGINGDNLLETAITQVKRDNPNVSGIKFDNLVNSKFEELSKSNSPTKYHSYQLPGGSNYKEMLLTLPNELKGEKAAQFDKLINEGRGDLAARLTKELPDDYKSSHWDEPNVLAHIRMNDRNIDGKKSLHLEEIQSDWHQEGRKKGYKSGEATKEYDSLIEQKGKAADELNAIRKKLADEVSKGYDIHSLSAEQKQKLTAKLNEAKANSKEFQDKNKAYTEIADKVDKGNPYMGVPDAPFKKTWDELALKKAITHAVKNGYDSISWTPGEAQAARYNLSKQINAVSANKNHDGTYQIGVKKPGFADRYRSTKEMDAVPANKLADFVGKELAEKIVNDTKYLNIGDKKEYSGLDLKVGGQGMKAFYDKMLVDKMNALTKKYGGKVTQSELPPKLSNKMGEAPIKQSVHVLKITPELREHVLKKGFPLFASAPIFTPVSHNPFEKDKQ